jgi:phosphohistidine phosphatase SixA
MRVIIVRHGEYGTNKELTDLGRSTISALGRRLSGLLGDSIPLIFHSATPRTRETAEILADMLHAEFSVLYVLGASPIFNKPELIALIRETLASGQEAVIWVTHEVQAAVLPGLFMLVDRSLPFDFFDNNLAPGEAFVIDLQQKTMTHFDHFGEETLVYPKE